MGTSGDLVAQLEAAIADLESQRSALGEGVVGPAVNLLRAQLSGLRQVPAATAPPLEAERKLVTILFADISGFTSLAESQDPEAVRDLINGCFKRMVPIIEKYSGVVDKFIGDEIMALFGAPLATENGPELALRAATDMREALAAFNADYHTDLGFHFGINTGLVVAGGVGSEAHQHYSVTGDAVNLAARLEDASVRDEILVGPETYRLASGVAIFEKLEPLKLKGKAEPVEVFRLLSLQRSSPGPAKRLFSAIVGRDKELKLIRQAWEDLGEGRGGVLAVIGEAGLGKSRLMAEARSELPPELKWFETRASSYGERVAYGVIQGLLLALLGPGPHATPQELGGLLRRSAQSVMGEKSAEFLPYLARLCGVPFTEAESERVKYLRPEALQGQMIQAFREYIRAFAAAAPLVLVWEDLHWIDPSSLRLLESLLPLTQQSPLLILLLFRPAQQGPLREFHERTLAAFRHSYRVLELAPLNRADSAGLLDNLLRIKDLPEATRRLVLDKAEGNPFYIEELLCSLIDSGAIRFQQGHAIATANLETIEIPTTLQGLIAARIDRLALEQKRTLQAASVVGRIFQQRVLAQLAVRGHAPATLDPALRELQQRELIRHRQTPHELLEFIFKHAVTHEVAYQSLLLATRRTLHREVAQTLETLFPERLDELAPILGYHYERAEIHEQALLFLSKAAERARAAYANDEAIAFYRAAIKQAEHLGGQSTCALQEKLAETLFSAGRFQDSRSVYGEALARIPQAQPVHRARLRRQQGNVFFEQRFVLEALADYDSAEAELGPASERREPDWWQEWLAIQIERTGVYYFENRLDDLAEIIKKSHILAERNGTPYQAREIREALVLLDCRRRRFYAPPDETLAQSRLNLELSRESGDLGEVAGRQFCLGMVYLWREEFDLAEAELLGALELSTRIGLVAVQTKCCTYLAVAHRRRGHVPEARDYASRGVLLATASGTVAYMAVTRGTLAWVHWREGDLARAEEQATAALKLHLASKNIFRSIIYWPLIGLALKHDRLAEALDYARTLLEPTEARLPDDIAAGLSAAFQSYDEHRVDEARLRLQQAAEKARAYGFL